MNIVAYKYENLKGFWHLIFLNRNYNIFFQSRYAYVTMTTTLLINYSIWEQKKQGQKSEVCEEFLRRGQITNALQIFF